MCKTEADIEEWMIDVQCQLINAGKTGEGNVIYRELLSPPEKTV